MQDYIDLASLGPTERLARLRAELLGLRGELLPEAWRGALLVNPSDASSIICQPSAFPFWRRLPATIPIVYAEDVRLQDDPKLRQDSWLAWCMTRRGLPASIIQHPPKTERHGCWEAWQEVCEEATLWEQQQPMIMVSPPLETLGRAEGESETPYRWQIVQDYAAFHHLLETWQASVGLDVETAPVGEPGPNDPLVGVGLAFDNECYYGTVDDSDFVRLLLAHLPRFQVVCWSAHYDAGVLLSSYDVRLNIQGDGMLCAYLSGEPRAALKPYIERTYRVRMTTYDDITYGGRRSIRDVPIEETARYCCSDAWWALKAERDLRPRLSSQALYLYEQVDLPLIQTLLDMEQAGITFDRDQAIIELAETNSTLKRLTETIDVLARESGFRLPDKRRVCKACRNGKLKRQSCTECSGAGEFFDQQHINPKSSDQLVAWLHGHLKLPVQALSQKTVEPSLSALALLRMRDKHPAISVILKHRKLEKDREFLESWIEASARDGRIHTDYTMAFVRSGRLSSRNPNLQQVEVSSRKLFIGG